MRASSLLMVVTFLGLSSACGGNEFSDATDGAGGAGGSGGSGTGAQGGSGGSSGNNAGGSSGGQTAGASGSGASGASGASGEGGAGGEAGQAGGAGGGGQEGGAAGSSGQQGGQAGTSGAGGGSGSGGGSGAGGGSGSGGASGSSGTCDIECAAPPDACGKAVCENGACTVVPNTGFKPVQTQGDCHVNVCSGTMTTSQVDNTDKPAPMGECDAPVCENGDPKHVDDDSLCPPTALCSSGHCICQPCTKKVAGLLNNSCQLPGGTSATAMHQLEEHLAKAAVDGSASTYWQAGDLAINTPQTETLTVDLGNPTAMVGITIFPRFAGAGPVSVSYAVTATFKDGTSESVPAVQKTMMGNDPQPIDLNLKSPRVVTDLVITATVIGSWVAIDEVVFRTGC